MNKIAKQHKKAQSRKNKTKNHKTKGGNMIQAAAIPLGLVALNHWFGTRSRTQKNNSSIKNKTRKYRK